ncbi:MAG: tetratricopeptide repeat protein [Myxococcota bacterium]
MTRRRSPTPAIVWCFALALVAGACASSVTAKDRIKARIRYDIGIVSLEQNDMRGALREILGAVEFDPDLAEAHNALGLIFHSMGRHDDSLAHYDRAVQIQPKFSEAHNNRGVLLLALGRYEGAIVSFEVALADILYITPSLAEGNLGWAQYKNGDVEQGLRHLRNAVAMNPKFCLGYGWLAAIEVQRQKPEQVVAYCKRFEKYCLADPLVAATVPPEFSTAMQYRLGVGYLGLGDRDAARTAFATCAEEQHESASAFKTKCERSLADID